MTGIVSIDHRCRILVIRCHGELDLTRRDELRTELSYLAPVPTTSRSARSGPQPEAAAVGTVIIDLSDVTFMDCTGLGVILAFARDCAAVQVHLLLADATPIVYRLLTVLELHRQFVVTSSLDEAVILARTWIDVEALRPGEQLRAGEGTATMAAVRQSWKDE